MNPTPTLAAPRSCGGSATARAGMNNYQFIAGCSVMGGYASQLCASPARASHTPTKPDSCV